MLTLSEHVVVSLLFCCLLICPCILILAEEKLIKTRIKELMRFRRNGITKLDGKFLNLL